MDSSWCRNRCCPIAAAAGIGRRAWCSRAAGHRQRAGLADLATICHKGSRHGSARTSADKGGPMMGAGRSRDGQPKSAGTGTSSGAGTPETDDATDAEATDAEATDAQAGQADLPDPPAAGRRSPGGARRAFVKIFRNHFVLLLAFEIAGIAATWPRFIYLADGKLPANRDAVEYVWDFWWVSRQLLKLANPFYTTHMAAPVGVQLGYDTLLPLPGWLLTPITAFYGPSASYTLLTIITPGLLCYVMYRAARLWLNVPGAIAAGAFFGLSSMLAWQDWYHVNIAVGTIFLPITLECAVRLRRQPGMRPAIGLGLALGASILVNQESTVVAVFLAAAILVPWIAGKLISDRAALRPAIWPLALGTLIALAVASPELIVMAAQLRAGGASPAPGRLAENVTLYGAGLPTLFAPSPRLASFGLGALTSGYRYSEPTETLATFGI